MTTPTSSAAGAWLPIESAPGDRPFLAMDAFWAIKRAWRCKFSDGSEQVVGWDDAKDFDATHWMPIPPPPSTEQSASTAPDKLSAMPARERTNGEAEPQ